MVGDIGDAVTGLVGRGVGGEHLAGGFFACYEREGRLVQARAEIALSRMTTGKLKLRYGMACMADKWE